MYTLELYEGPRARDPIAAFEAPTTFQAISVGDFVNDQFMRDDGAPQDPLLRVVRIEHLIWDAKKGNGPQHKLMIYCERELSRTP
jgi:hypothetical protein